MSLCGRYDFVEPALKLCVVPFYYKRSDLDEGEIDQFRKTSLGYYVDATIVKEGQRCQMKPKIHLAKHFHATLEADPISESLQGRFQLWLNYKPTLPYEQALVDFVHFLDEGISIPKKFCTEYFQHDLDQDFQYHLMTIQKKPYVAIQPKQDNVYLPSYQKPEIYWIRDVQGFDMLTVQYVLDLDRPYWYVSTQDFYIGGGHGFKTRSRWQDDEVVLEALVDDTWAEVKPYGKHFNRPDAGAL